MTKKYKSGKSISKKLFMAPLTRLRATMPGHMPNTLMGKYYSQRSGNNGASNIITEATNVSDTATGYYAEPGIFTEIQEFEWKKIIDLVHSKGSKIWCQLWHVGRVSHFSLQPNGNKPISATSKRCSNLVPIDSSMKRVPCSEPRSIETSEIVGLVNSFKQAAIRAKNAGFDGVEIHGANGYLLEQFLRSGINNRTDSYGGTLKNRMRFCIEVVEAVCEVWKPDQVGYRISPISGDMNGDRGEENMIETYGALADQLSEMNLAFLDVVESFSGLREDGIDEVCARLRTAFNGIDGKKKYIAGGGYDWKRGKEALNSNHCDALIFGKLFLANPDLAFRFKNDLTLNEPDKSTFYKGGDKGYTDYPKWVE